MTNGTVFSGWLDQAVPDSLPLLLALELLDDSEIEASDVLGEEDDMTLFSVASSYMRRNLNRVRDYFDDTIPLFGRMESAHNIFTRGNNMIAIALTT